MTKSKYFLIGVVLAFTSMLAIYFFKLTEGYKDYYADGSLKSVYALKGNKIHGNVLEYFPSGNIKSKVEFKDGVQHGSAVFYDEDGSLKSKSYFKDGVQSDTMTVYYKNGNLQEVCLVRNGKKDGFFKTYYEDGKIRSEGFAYKNGHDSLWKYFDQDGGIDRLENYSKDTLISVTKYFRDEIEYQNKIGNYKITMPRQWNVKRDGKRTTVFALERNDGKSFRVTATILLRNLNDLYFDKFVDTELKYTAAYTSNFRLINRKKTRNTIQTTYTATYSGFSVKVLCTFFEEDHKVYSLTFIALEEEFGNYDSIFKQASNTFRISA